MEYPWWTIEASRWGTREETDIHCIACAEALGQVLGSELTDTEINQHGGVRCQSCGRYWPAVETSLRPFTADAH